jgi:hypothetical protein
MTANNPHMTPVAGRLARLKKTWGDSWRAGVQYARPGYSRSTRRPEYRGAHTDERGKKRDYWYWDTGTSRYHHSYAGELDPRGINHYGWYADEHQSETVRGLVMRIRTSRGTIYAPGYQYSDSDMRAAELTPGETLIVPPGSGEDAHQDAARTVANWADDMARRVAERDREYDSVFHAQQATDDARDAVTQARAAASQTVTALRQARDALPPNTDAPQLCDLLRGSLRQARAALHDALDGLRQARYTEAEIRSMTGITEQV